MISEVMSANVRLVNMTSRGEGVCPPIPKCPAPILRCAFSFVSCLNYSYSIVVLFYVRNCHFRDSHASFSSYPPDCVFYQFCIFMF